MNFTGGLKCTRPGFPPVGMTSSMPRSIHLQDQAGSLPATAGPDDAAVIFIHSGDASKNAIIGTDKQRGLIVYDVQGRAVHRYPFGRINNVGLRQEVDWNGRRITIEWAQPT